MHNFDSQLIAAAKSSSWFQHMYETYCGKPLNRTSWRDRAGTTLVSNDAPECGGGGAAANTSSSIAAATTDSDDGGDPDPEPEPSRRSASEPSPASSARRARLLPLARVSADTSLGRSSIYALIQRGIFPPPLKIGRSSRWLADEIDAWLAERIASRDAQLSIVPPTVPSTPSLRWTSGGTR
jgi:prophage regulatory protein